jgi:hypothetical protein
MNGTLPLTVRIPALQTPVRLLGRGLLGKWVIYFDELFRSRLHRTLIRVAPLDIEKLEWIC